MLNTAGLNKIINDFFTVQTCYVGVFGNNYTPQAADVMATFVANAGELTVYDEATRPEFVESAAANGETNNTEAQAEFTFNQNATVYGCFIATVPTKGATTGTLLAAYRYPTPISMLAGGKLFVSTSVFMQQPV